MRSKSSTAHHEAAIFVVERDAAIDEIALEDHLCTLAEVLR